ncbi:MAG TPA: NAD-dependent epimerase/dehydratase family protein [Candidatus Polarisedimenticolaceae bacterium]|nr:NAD-dependent epimerase/dehydratase family protein [Candidatus Polarisedimenticolaceae bacterium]
MTSTAGLIGHTGFVGSTLRAQTRFDDLFHSPDIAGIRGRRYELLVCAGAPAAKWKANQEPQADRANLDGLIEHLRHVRAERFLLISTVDVYPRPLEVDELTPIEPAAADAYGRHRYLLEEFVRERFPRACVLRLPGLFGTGLRKNFIYDLLHDNCLHLTHRDSVFQFYDMSRLWQDAQAALRAPAALVNFATTPVAAGEVARRSFGVEFATITPKPPVRYDVRTRHAVLFGASGPYLYSAEETFQRIARYVAAFRAEQER